MTKAADVSLNSDPYEVIPKAVAASITILEAAEKAPSIKSFVLTSSSLSALQPQPNKTGIVVTEGMRNLWLFTQRLLEAYSDT